MSIRVPPLDAVRQALLDHPDVADAHVAELTFGQREAHIAYVVLSQARDGCAPSTTPADQVDAWSDVFDDVEGTSRAIDARFDTVGWEQDRTGERLATEDIVEWVATSVDRLLELRPARVLEIGCGAGNLMWRIAPTGSRYVACELSPATATMLARRVLDANLPHVEVLCREAADFRGFAPGSFDTVVINSTAQYFPSLAYLVSVLEGAAAVVAPGGHIFLGDLRSLAVYDAWCAFAAAGGVEDPELRWLPWQAARVRATEPELLIDPRFFVAWGASRPDVANVSLMPRRGRRWSEMTRFRYDAVLRVAGRSDDRQRLQQVNSTVTWDDVGASIEHLLEYLAVERPECVRVEGIPNARILPWASLWNRAHGRQAMDQRVTPVDPEDLWLLARAAPYRVELSVAAGAPDGALDAILVRIDDARPDISVAFVDDRRAQGGLDEYVREPLESRRQAQLERALARRLRAFVAERLGDTTAPEAFVTLPELPRNSAGEVQTAGLPAPIAARPPTCGQAVLPRTELEYELAELWSEMLMLEIVGVEDDYFDLGGHGYLARQMLWLLRDTAGVRVPLASFLRSPTVAGLAATIGVTAGEAPAVVAALRRRRR